MGVGTTGTLSLGFPLRALPILAADAGMLDVEVVFSTVFFAGV